VKKLILMISLLTLTLLPWVVRNYIVFDRLLLSTNKINFGVMNNPEREQPFWEIGDKIFLETISEETELEIMDESIKIGLAFIRKHPGRYASFVFQRFCMFWGVGLKWWHCLPHALLHWIIYALAIAGVVKSRQYFLLTLIVFYMIPVLLIGNSQARIRVPVEWFTLMYVGYALSRFNLRRR